MSEINNHKEELMFDEKVQAVLDRINGKGGESYDGEGRHGWRNPIRDDTSFLLHSLIRAEQPKLVLELGTAYGKSGIYIATALPEGGRLHTVEFFDPVAKEAEANFTDAGLPVTVLSGDADAVIATYASAPRETRLQFDAVFFDAEKQSYGRHLKALRDQFLLSRDCLIIADNVIDRREECREFLDVMINRSHFIFRTECGLLVGRL